MRTPILLCLVAVVASAAPVIRSGASGVVNAASNSPLGPAGSGIAQGSFFVIYGSGLGPSSIAIASAPFPSTVGGASVTVTPSSGSPVTAFLYYAVDTQVSGILPSNTPVGPATVTVTFNGATSAPAKINVVKSDFGIFTLNQAGSGPGAILNRNPDGLNALSSAVAPGQFLELYGTGLGPISEPDNAAPGAVTPAGIDVKVLVAGQPVAPFYAGRSPTLPGVDQIDVQVPADASVPDGCFVPVAVSVNGVVSNYATFAKATTGKTCPAPLGLATTALQKLDAGGKINIGVLSLARSAIQASLIGIPINASIEQAGGTFASLDSAGLFQLLLTPGSVPPLNAVGTCLVQTQESSLPPLSTIPSLPKPLNAGTKLTLTGPNNKTQDLPATNGAGYSAILAQQGASLLSGVVPGIPSLPAGLPSSFIEPGQWSIKGPGGSDIGAFTASVTVPTPLTCTNCNFTSIDRTQPLTINWSGGGGSQDYVQIVGIATTPSVADSAKNVAVAFSCTARASDATFTVPVSILGQLPTSSADLAAPTSGIFAIVNGLGSANAAFTAPGLDSGYFGYSSLQYRTMGFK